MVLCRNHNRHASHAGDVGGHDGGGGQRWRGRRSLDLQLRVAVCLRHCLGLGQLGVALGPGHGAATAAAIRQQWLFAWQGGVVVVAVMSRGGGPLVAGRPVASSAACGGDDGCSV